MFLFYKLVAFVFLIPISTSLLVFLLECLNHNRAQNCIDDMDKSEHHGYSSDPACLVLQYPRQFLNAAINVCISGDCVSALLWQRMPVEEKVVWAVGTAAAHLKQTYNCKLNSAPFPSNMTYVLLQERQGFPAGNVIRGHNKPADGMLQNRLDTGVCCTVVQQQSSSHYAEYKGKDLRTHKLKNYNYYRSNIVVLLQLTISRVTGFSIKALQQPRKEVTMTITAIPIRM